MHIKKTLGNVSVVLLLLFGFSGAGIESWLDNFALKAAAEKILREPVLQGSHELRAFLDTFFLQQITLPPRNITYLTTARKQWLIKKSLSGSVINEKCLLYAGAFSGFSRDTACYYLYRTGPLKNGKVILWVPGMGVSDFAFVFIRQFFQIALDRGYAVAVYIPPYHMERHLPGKGNGEGFFSGDPQANVDVILTMVRELRALRDHLTDRGVVSFGGWGGSMGASALLLLASFQQFSHIAVMIPVLNWSSLMAENKNLQPVAQELKRAGYDSTLLHKAYSCVSPVYYALLVPPERMLILYAQYDQLTPETITHDYAAKKNIVNIAGFKRSHTTILLTHEMYLRYADFLDRR